MNTRSILLYLLSFIVVNCTPKNEEVTEEQIEIGDATEVLDTIANTKKDAVQTDENNITPTLPLPQPVLQLLTERYPGWQEPTYTQTVRNAATGNKQGPSIVRGDFNNDNRQDYGIQLQQQNNLYIVAMLDGDNRNWQLHELHKDILFNDRGELKSPYLLQVTEAGAELQQQGTGKILTSPYQGIRLGLEESGSVYLFENGKFSVYTLAE